MIFLFDFIFFTYSLLDLALAGRSHSSHTHHWVTRRLCHNDGDHGHIIILLCMCVASIKGRPCAHGQKCHSRLPRAHYAISCLRPQSICWAGSVTEPFHRVTPPAGGRSAERCVRERDRSHLTLGEGIGH